MARKLTFVASAKPGQISVSDVPQDVKDEIDSIFEHLAANPGLEGYAQFDGEGFEGKDADDKARKEAAQWERQVRAYCESREAGILKYRRLPSKTLPPGICGTSSRGTFPPMVRQAIRPSHNG